MIKYIPVKGTKDFLPQEFSAYEYVVNTARILAMTYGFEPMQTPIIEQTNTYSRTLGDSSDVVNKEMYSFSDKGGDEITLRPEFTAGIVRCFISNGLHHQLPIKYFSSGAVFRHERPQAGRQRQFHQLNFEHLGASEPYHDAELIKCGAELLNHLGILENTTLELNSLGCNISRANYRQSLIAYFNDFKSDLSADSLRRLATNPLRILDSKDPTDQQICLGAPRIAQCYTDEARIYFDTVLKFLDDLSVKYVINDKIVRGLDYYNHTIFEFTTDKIGAQSTVLAGGRYDNLVKTMGGPAVSAVGFAAGIERLLLMNDFTQMITRPIYIIALVEAANQQIFNIAQHLRHNGLACIVELGGKINKKLQRANNKNAQFVIFIGSDELSAGQVKIKNLDDGQEQLMTITAVLDYFIKK